MMLQDFLKLRERFSIFIRKRERKKEEEREKFSQFGIILEAA